MHYILKLIIILFSILIPSTFCWSYELKVSYKPLLLPFVLNLGTNTNNISLKLDKSIVTPIGVFSLSASQEIISHRNQDIFITNLNSTDNINKNELLLIIIENDHTKVFKIRDENKLKLEFQGKVQIEINGPRNIIVNITKITKKQTVTFTVIDRLRTNQISENIRIYYMDQCLANLFVANEFPVACYTIEMPKADKYVFYLNSKSTIVNYGYSQLYNFSNLYNMYNIMDGDIYDLVIVGNIYTGFGIILQKEY